MQLSHHGRRGSVPFCLVPSSLTRSSLLPRLQNFFSICLVRVFIFKAIRSHCLLKCRLRRKQSGLDRFRGNSRRACCGVARLAPLAILVAGQANAAVIESLFYVQRGTAPIVISAPHGGESFVDGIADRDVDGNGSNTRPSFVGRDANTKQLALELSRVFEARTGLKPYTVISDVARAQIDFNRKRGPNSYDDGRMAEYHDYYWGNLADFTSEVKDQWGSGVLLDLHGFTSGYEEEGDPQIYRGTRNGLLVQDMLNDPNKGEEALTGPNSIYGQLANKYVVSPTIGGSGIGFEERFTGDQIVVAFGSNNPNGIDAIMMEIYRDLRFDGAWRETAEDLASAVEVYHREFLVAPVPEPGTIPVLLALGVAVGCRGNRRRLK